jgi:hypothetical protein
VIEALHVVKMFLWLPDVYHGNPTEEIRPARELIWVLHAEFPYGLDTDRWYVCQQGLLACGDDDRCSTPVFRGRYVPEEVTEWMAMYASILSQGMILGHQEKRTA